MEFIIVLYLVLMFIALYMFSFFILLTLKNHKRLFEYPEAKKIYSVSVITPVWNEEESVKETIEHVMELNYPKNKIEVIVVNDGSTDKTEEVVKSLLKKYPNLKLLTKKNTGKADSINYGLKLAKGELVAVIDADSFPSPDSLKKLVGFFNNPQMGAVTSFVKIRDKDKSFLAKIQSLEYMVLGWARKLLDFVDSVYVTNGPLSLYRKKYLLEIGGFDPKSITEDIDVTWNMLAHDYKTAMCLDARVSTLAPHKFKAWFRQRTRWGLGGLQAIAKYKRMFFRKGMFGAFILPFVSFSIIVSIIGFLFSVYVILKGLLTRFLVAGYSASSGVSLFHFEEMNLHPSVILFYMIILLSCSLIYYNYVLHKAKYDEKLTIKRFFNLLFYILVYLALYPTVWFNAIRRFIFKDYKW